MYIRERVGVTIVIWGVVGIVALMLVMNAFMIGEDQLYALTLLVIVMTVAAAVSTQAVWRAGLGMLNAADMTGSPITEKHKRGADTRVSQILASLSESELADLRERMLSQDQDDEMTTLEALLSEARRQRR